MKSLRAVTLLALFAPVTPGVAGAAEECDATFNPDVAHRLWSRMVSQHGADGCALDDVRTDRSRMEIVWKRTGAGQVGTVVLEPSSCAAPPRPENETLALEVPPELARACPDAVGALLSVVRELDLPTARTEATFPFSLAVVAWAVLAGALLGAGAVASKALEDERPSE